MNPRPTDPKTSAHAEDVRISALRRSHYNATVVGIRRVHEELLILHIEPDDGPIAYEAGQYTVLGLGYWEPRLEATQDEALTEKQRHTLAKRAYSMSCPILDEQGKLARPGRDRKLEFYVSLVQHAGARLPALTPRLFLLEEADRLYVGPRAHGRYTLAPVQPDDDVLFAATGTGEAPHNAMIAELLASGHRGRIASIVCARYTRDLAYLAQHRQLEKRFENYRYVPLTTREPQNVDPTHLHFVGKVYIQDLIASEDLESRTCISLDPEKTHIFLCGSPDMIGAPRRHEEVRFSVQGGMVELLEERGFRIDAPRQPGNIHFESYW